MNRIATVEKLRKIASGATDRSRKVLRVKTTNRNSKRIWFVECLTTDTANFVANNIESNIGDTMSVSEVLVEVVEKGEKVLTPKNNLTQISWEGVEMLNFNRSNLGLKYNIYMKESEGAKCTPWKMGQK